MKNLLLFLTALAALASAASAASAQPSRIKEDTAKTIADATPPSLPQSPRDTRPRSDAQDADLKGKVKSITYRHTDHEQPRYPKQMLTREEFYGEDGNLLRAVDWDDVWPIGVTVYGYLDGKRVSRRGSVEYADGEKPAEQSTVPMIQTLPGTGNDKSISPSRYDMRWVYKYDLQGRLADETHFDSTGRVVTRTVYNYKSDTHRILLHYAGGVEPLATTEEKIDRDGNVIEELIFDEDGKVSNIRSYAYKFDKRGNWLERKVTERSPGEKSAKPISTTYRAIIYYS